MRRIIRLLHGIIALTLILVSLNYAREFFVASPESMGFSSERLERLTAVIDHQIDQEPLAGTVVLIVRDEQVAYFQTAGM